MLNIAVCDDDVQTTGKIDMMLQKAAKQNFVDIDVEVYWNGKNLVDAVKQKVNFDIIYLDIEIGKEDGVSVAKRIRHYDKNVKIIYVTSYENYMKDSFQVHPFQFLVKPVEENVFEECFKLVVEDINSEDFYFRYRFRKVNYKVPVQEILYFKSDKRKIIIVTEKDIFVLYGKLNEIEEYLKEGKVSFLRVHQSFLVNYRHIERQANDFVEMDNGEKIFISEDRRKKISEQYCSMEDIFYVGE